ncbi:MAG: DUF692 domain-containing protein [Proteobacteria bacterium]|jgi:uncharacterized protein (UPF0276 family)|nr:DUF692 domain-containing protein [Pseudomonadota bacterium]MDA1302550.1 DUF692 domain-containing protein [Pseudomonadota bacterium]
MSGPVAGLQGVGLGVRSAFWPLIVDGSLPLDFVEVTAEHFFDDDLPLVQLSGLPVAVHSLGLSLGSPEPLDEAYLDRVRAVAERADAVCSSDHLAFTRANGIDLGHLNPVPLSDKMFDRIASRVDRVQQITGRVMLLENITTHLQLPGARQEPRFLTRLAYATGCGILLDLTNLYVNARNFGFDPEDYLSQMDLARVGQIHLVGYSERAGRLHDEHARPVQQELLSLLRGVLMQRPDIGVLLEWDRDLPDAAALAVELTRIREVVDGCRLRPCQTVV